MKNTCKIIQYSFHLIQYLGKKSLLLTRIEGICIFPDELELRACWAPDLKVECARGLYGYSPLGQLPTTASGVGAVCHQVRRVCRDREGQ